MLHKNKYYKLIGIVRKEDIKGKKHYYKIVLAESTVWTYE